MAFKYIITLENESKFISYKFGKDRKDQKSVIRLYAANYQARLDYVKKIYRSEIKFKDRYFNIAGLGDETEMTFDMEHKQTRIMPYTN